MGERLIGVGLIALSLLCTGEARATETTAPITGQPTAPLPPQLQKLSNARAAADAAIVNESAIDLFDNITDGDVPKVRHRASGLVCVGGDTQPPLSVHIYPGLPRGDDVSCESSDLQIITTFYATRYGAGVTAQEIVQGSIAAIRQRFQDVKPYAGQSVTASKDGMPTPLTARFEASYDGHRLFTRTSAVAVGDWIIAERVSAPIEKALTADLMAEAAFAEVLIGMTEPK